MDNRPDHDVALVPDLAVRPVRLREDVSSAGADGPCRVVHLVARAAEMDGSDDVQAHCGVRLMPGVWEDAPWGELWPHAKCVERAPVRRSVLERAFQAAETPSSGSEEEWKASFQIAENVMNQREDWVNEDASQDWFYTASFNGAVSGEYRFPRSVDVGLDPLSAELVRPHVFRIHSCGVRDGCPKHAAQSETFSLDEVNVIVERLAAHEDRAVSIDLQELAWCLIFGACSKSTLTVTLR